MSHPSAPKARRPARQRGFLLQLFVFLILPLTAMLVAVPLGSLALHARAMRDLVGERDSRAARAAADTIAEQLHHRAAGVRGLAAHAAQAAQPQTALDDFAFLNSDFEGGLALLAADGALLAPSPARETWQARPVSALAASLADGSGASFSTAFEDPPTGRTAMLVGARRGQVLAVGAFFPASLAERALMGIVSDNGHFSAWLVDGQRQVLFQTGTSQPGADLARHPGVVNALRGESGTTHMAAGDGEHIVSYAPVPPIGLALVIEEAWEAVDNPLLRQTLAAPLILIPALLFALVAVWFGIRQIVQPLQTLERQAAELGWGRFEAIERPAGGIGEIRRLQAELIRMAHKVRAAQQNLRSYAGAITTGQEDERQRLARDLHDGAVQALIALDQRVQLTQLAAKEAAPDAAARWADIRRMIVALIEDVRRVIRNLRPIYLEDLGLLPALEMLARDLEKTAQVRVEFASAGQAVRLAPEREIAVYRIAQEILSNIARHAQAQTVRVDVGFTAGEFSLRVQDDGRGFALPERISDLAAAGHYGLLGLQERADLIGGRLGLESAPGQGTTVRLHLPL